MHDDWIYEYGSDRFTFSSGDLGYALAAHPKQSQPDVRTADSVLPRTDGMSFGTDFLGGTTISLQITVTGDSPTDVAVRRDRLFRAWRSAPLRADTEAVASLRVRDRLTFGRPRRIAADDESSDQGRSWVSADFQTVDSNWYSLLNEERLNFGAQPTGGFVFPAVFPISTIGDEGSGSRSIDVGGTGLAYPVLVVVGPILSPIVEIGRRFWSFPGLNVRDGQTLTIDTQPWNRTIWSNGAPRVPTRGSTPLTRSGLEPGRHVIALRGTSESGTAGLIIRWRNSWSSY